MEKDADELPSKATKRQLKIGIFVTVIGIPISYFLLSATANLNTPPEDVDLRMVNGVVNLMHTLAPPWFWTLLLLCPLVYEIIWLSIQYVRQKREEKMGNKEE